MLQHITDLYIQILESSKANPILATVFSVWGLGVVTVLLRKVPATIFRFIATQFTTTIIFNNGGYWGNREIFQSFLLWYVTTKHFKLSRTLSLDGSYSTRDRMSSIVGPGYGKHFFIHNRRLFWFVKSSIASPGTEMQKEEIVLYTYGRNQKVLRDLVDSFLPVEDKNKLYIYKAYGKEWERIATLNKRSLDSVAIPKEIKEIIVKQIKEYYEQRDWYLAQGLPHKITTMLHGLPGCGKTSLVKALASYFNAHLYIINISVMSDEGLEKCIASIPKGSFLLIEDIDSSSAIHSRSAPVGDAIINTGSSTPLQSSMTAFSMQSLTGVLNAFDGIIPLDNIAVFTTTNHIEKLDAAFKRTGRIDLTIELKYLQDAEIKQHVLYVYKDCETFDYALLSANTYHPLSGSDLTALILLHKKDFLGFMDDLNKRKETKSKAPLLKLTQ